MKTLDDINNLQVISTMGYFSYRGYIDSTKGIEALKPQFSFHKHYLN